MHKSLLRYLLFTLLLSSCISTAHLPYAATASQTGTSAIPAALSTWREADTAIIRTIEVPADQSLVSLMELPRTEDGAFVLAPGLYEADFKTYCLQPGTPGPSAKDAYFQAPLQGPRKELLQTILLNSRQQSQLNQKDVQLLVWSVVTQSDFHKLSPDVKYTAMQLLSPKQLFELQGGVLGVVKTVARVLPSSGGQSDLRKLFDLSVRSYEAFEQLAVLNTPSQIWRTDINQEQWSQQSEGYYIRFIPHNYKQTKIQVYVPESVVDTAAQETGNYIVFDPTSWMVMPANSNAQRLGVGGPVVDIVKKVIRGIKSKKGSERTPPAPKGEGRAADAQPQVSR